jgi:hypothetical protein
MNISIELHNFSLVNINFLDTKRNIIMDGNFTKIIYSNQWFTINSIYIHFPIEIVSIEKNLSKSFLRFNPYSPKNLQIIQDMVKIESRILEYFKKFFNLNLRISNMLSKQLYTGNMKIFKEYVDKSKTFCGETTSFRSEYIERNFGQGSKISTTKSLGQRPDDFGKGSKISTTKSLGQRPDDFSQQLTMESVSRSEELGHGHSGHTVHRSPTSGLKPTDELYKEVTEPRGDKMFVIKISGIWDNYEELGLTYKLLEVQGTVW